MVTCPVLPHTVYSYQLIRFARVCSYVSDIKARNKILTANFSNRAISVINFEKLFFFQNFIADTMNWFLNSRSD